MGRLIIIGLKKKTEGILRKWNMKKGRNCFGRFAYTSDQKKKTATKIKHYLSKNIHGNHPNCIKVGSVEPAFTWWSLAYLKIKQHFLFIRNFLSSCQQASFQVDPFAIMSSN